MNLLINRLAQQAVEETRSLMIMEFKNFESTLYTRFAELIVEECAQAAERHARSYSDGVSAAGCFGAANAVRTVGKV